MSGSCGRPGGGWHHWPFLCSERPWASGLIAADGDEDEDDDDWWSRGHEERCGEMTSMSPRFPLFSISLDWLWWNPRLVDRALNSRDLHHNHNPISHLSLLPIATWGPIQKCDSNISDVLCTLALVLTDIVCCYVTQGNLWEALRGSTCLLVCSGHSVHCLFRGISLW